MLGPCAGLLSSEPLLEDFADEEFEDLDDEDVVEVAVSSFFGLFCRLCVEVLELELSESEEYFRLLVAGLSRFPAGLRWSVGERGAAPKEGDRMLSMENLRLFWCSWCRWCRRAVAWSRRGDVETGGEQRLMDWVAGGGGEWPGGGVRCGWWCREKSRELPSATAFSCNTGL